MPSAASQQDHHRTVDELEQELYLREFEMQLLKETAEAFSSHLRLDRLFQLVIERARNLIQGGFPVVDDLLSARENQATL